MSGKSPSAWNLELAWMPTDRWQLGVRAEQADDFLEDLRRYGTTASYAVHEHVFVSLEYLHSHAKGEENDPSHLVTAQLALEF